MDLIPQGLILNDANWTLTLGGAFYNNSIASIPVGQTETISITFQIDPDYMGGTILNQAEIIDPDNDDPDDIDSDPDISVDDDDNDDGQDDDDEDDEVINITHSFDLALIKVIDTNNTSSPVQPGDNVTFDITVENQGTLDATNVVVEDYLSSDMTFNQADNVDFTILGNDVRATIPFIQAGGSASVSITIQINDDFSGSSVVNNAEIISADNAMGLPDEDDPLSNVNDGSTNELSTDNDINDTATTGIADNPNDEDDYDPALVDIDCNLAPHCATLGSIDAYLDANGEVTITPQDIDNNSSALCDDATTLSLQIDNDSFDCSDLGSGNIVNMTVTDNLGNVSTGICQTNVTVIDTIPPTVSCQDVTVDYVNGNPVLVIATVTQGSEDDNCTVDNVAFDLSGVDLATLPCTPQNAQVVATDQSGNSGTCSFLITIENDPPQALCKSPFEVMLGNDGTMSINADLIDNGSSDDCTDQNDLVLTIDQSNFDCDDIGMVTVTLTVTDESGLTDQCSTTLNIVDNIPPVALCEDITIDLNANGNVSINTGQIDNGSTDNCTDQVDLDFSLDQNTFMCNDVSQVNVVVLTVTDESGNTDTCSATVSVNDVHDPEVSCNPDFTVNLDNNGEATVVVGDIIDSSSDACGIDTEVIDIDSFDCDDIGSTITVTATVTDVNGNSSTCSTDVTVVDDSDPSCTLISGIDIPANQSLDVNTFLDTYTDNCNDTAATATIDPASFDCNMLGTQTVTVTVTDDSGNDATCTASVTVIDVTEPICQTMDITVQLNSLGEAMITGADVDDGSTAGCSTISDLSVTPNIFACNDVGDNIVTLTVTSSNGMTSTCTAIVTVEDNVPPTITCVANVTFDLNNNGVANISAGDILTSSTDGCGILSEVIDINSFDCSDKGSPITVTATVTDMNGNTSTCSSQVTIEDNIAPECTLLPNLEFIPDVTIDLDDVLDTFTDNCATGTATITTQTEFDCDDVGTHTTIVMVTDTCGNSNTCSVEIEIVDTDTPACSTMDITVSLDNNGEYDLDPSEVDDGSSAACGGAVTLSVDPDEFDCGDIGNNVVTLTVTSSGGASSTCTATVTIEDNSPPTIVCPADQSIPCDSDLSDLTVFGTATASDNCDMNAIVVVNNVFDVNACNVGTVERTFMATDGEGNTSTCMQVITINPPTNPVTESDITWPATPFDAGDCIADPDNIDSGMPTVDTSNADCSNISISFVDVDPTPGTSGCNDQYERTWMVIDSCQLDGMGSGIFTFLQIINLNDSVGPTIMGPSDITITLDPMSCDTFLTLPATISDCIGGFSATNDSQHADSMATEDATGTYPAGATDVTITAVDTCGNESQYTYTVNVIDTSSVLFSCDKVIETMTSSLVVAVPVDLTNVTIMSMCSDTIFDISFSNMSPDIDTIYADCSFVGLTNYTVYLWSGNVILDSCTNLLQILDGAGFCPNPLAGTISGSISTEDDRMVDDVFVDLIGSDFAATLTNQEGIYAFPSMPYGGSYEVLPIKDIDPLNGVSTLDLIKIQRHILGIETLTSPYKLIAADIDNSGSVTTLDLLELRKLILGVYEDFPQNTSWRMVDASYNFIDPYNPFLYDIPEDYEITSFESSMDIDFIGVKIGDVNNSVTANIYDRGIEGRSMEEFRFIVEDKKLKSGEVTSIVFSSDAMQNTDGYQYTLDLDTDKVQIVGFNPIDPTMNMNNVNLAQSDNGMIHISWNKTSEYGTELTNLFEIIVRSRSDVWISELAIITDNGIPAQAYKDNEIQDITIEYKNSEAITQDLILYQNQPNPWLETTDIKFYSPGKGDIILNVYDVNGRMIHSKNFTASRGLNKVELRKTDIGTASGILYYELVSGKDRLMEKMLLLR